MNTKMGCAREGYERVIGKHGLGQRNDNGKRLLNMRYERTCYYWNTLLPYNMHKATWISLNRRTKNQIDHRLINKRFRNSVKDTRVYRSADIRSDQRLS